MTGENPGWALLYGFVPIAAISERTTFNNDGKIWAQQLRSKTLTYSQSVNVLNKEKTKKKNHEHYFICTARTCAYGSTPSLRWNYVWNQSSRPLLGVKHISKQFNQPTFNTGKYNIHIFFELLCNLKMDQGHRHRYKRVKPTGVMKFQKILTQHPTNKNTEVFKLHKH